MMRLMIFYFLLDEYAKHIYMKDMHPYQRNNYAGWRIIGKAKILIHFKSIWEANYARYLDFLVEQKQIREWQYEPTEFYFDHIKKGCTTYRPDFYVVEQNANNYYVEVKGFLDHKSKTKIKRFQKYYPEEELRIVDKKWFLENGKKLCSIISDWESPKNLKIIGKSISAIPDKDLLKYRQQRYSRKKRSLAQKNEHVHSF